MSQTDDTHTTPEWVGEKSWTNPFPEGSWLHGLFDKRVSEGRDLIFIVDDYWSGRGTGKTISCLQIAEGMDQNGGLTREHASLDPEELREAYSNLPRRSGLILDEGEVGISNRDSMTNVNKAMREVCSMGRVEEKYLGINAPSWNFLDKDVKQLADVWITMVAKGIGLVHAVKPHPYLNRILTPKKELIHFNDVATQTDLRDVYNHLKREKQRKLDGDDGSGYIEQSEAKKQREKAEEQAERDTRNDLLYTIYTHPDTDITQATLGDCADITPQMVNKIIQQQDSEQ